MKGESTARISKLCAKRVRVENQNGQSGGLMTRKSGTSVKSAVVRENGVKDLLTKPKELIMCHFSITEIN